MGISGRGQSIIRSLGGEHPALHGVVRPFDLGNVHESGGTPDECAPGEVERGHRLEAAFGEGACTVGEARRGTGEEAAEVGVMFHPLARGWD